MRFAIGKQSQFLEIIQTFLEVLYFTNSLAKKPLSVLPRGDRKQINCASFNPRFNSVTKLVSSTLTSYFVNCQCNLNGFMMGVTSECRLGREVILLTPAAVSFRLQSTHDSDNTPHILVELMTILKRNTNKNTTSSSFGESLTAVQDTAGAVPNRNRSEPVLISFIRAADRMGTHSREIYHGGRQS